MPARKQREAWIKELRLLEQSEMEAIFPQADIEYERVLSFTKSLIAIHEKNDPLGENK